VSIGSRICPGCGKLNARDDARCSRCDARLPAGWETAVRDRWGSALQRRGWATTLFMVIDGLVYAALMLGGTELLGSVRRLEALRWGALVGELGHIEPWRYLSAMFVHFSLLHVGFNTLTLHQLGRSLEDAVGWGRFVVVFVGTGVAGFLASELWYTPVPLTGGISGGIFGLLGAAVGWRFAQRDPEWKRLAITGVGYAVAMALIPGVTVNHAAHGGGLVAGAGFGWALYRLGRGRSVDRAMNLIGALLILGTFASIGLSLTSPIVRSIRPGLVR
jgi:membrane associated rhomboid family serine protease